MRKKLIALFLAVCMIGSMNAFAADDATEKPALSGVCDTGDGSFLATDTFNKVLWRVKDGVLTRYAGAIPVADLSGEPQGLYYDGASEKAYFMEPWDIVPFLDGYAVSDAGANAIRYVTDKEVRTFAGGSKAGKADGSGTRATFDRPTGLAVNDKGELYVADTGNGAIRRVSKTGAVATYVKGLSEPSGLCWYDGALYVAETGRSRILRVVNGKAEVYAGTSEQAEDSGEYYGGFANGPATSARFDHLQGLAADADGTMCVADTLNRAIRIIRDGRVYTVMTGVTPRGMAIQNGSIYAADLLSGNLVDAKLPTGSYADVPADAWYGSYVKETTLRGLINGTDSNRFSPQLKLDRAMFVTVLSRLHSYTDGTVVIDGDETFPDVAEGIWYAASARWAADNGIVTGMDGAFAPTAAVTREQLATMLYRYAKARGLDVSASAELDVFSDADSVSGWAVSAMRWAVAAGVVGGENGLLRPDVPATRAEAVTIVIRFMDACGL